MVPIRCNNRPYLFASALLVFILLIFTACSSSDTDPVDPEVIEPVKVSGTPTVGGLININSFAWAPDSTLIAYIAKQATSSQELYSSTPDGTINVNVAPVPLPSGGNVVSFVWSPDLTVTNRIAYLADQDTFNVDELYSSAPDGSNNKNRSDPDDDMVPGGFVLDSYDWALLPADPDTIVFRSNRDNATIIELYASSDDGTTVSVIKLSGTMTAGGNVLDFSISPDGTRVAYLADQETDGTNELYTVPVNGSTAPVNISVLAPANHPNVIEFAWAPNGSRIAYRAQNLFSGPTGGNIELFTALPTGGTPIVVSKAPVQGQRVEEFAWAPDSLQLAYTANVTLGSPNLFDLYVTSPISIDNIKLTVGLPPSADVNTIAWAPNSLLIAFLADLNVANFNELFVANPAIPPTAPPVPISGTLVSGGEVIEYAWAPDSSRIAYRADRFVDNKIELFTVLPTGTQSPITISQLTQDGSDVIAFAWSPNLAVSNRIAYTADQETVGVFELYSVSPTGASNINISGGLEAGEEVTDFAWAPDASLIAYQSNQDDVTKYELYTTESQ